MFPIFLPQSLITFSSCFAHGWDSHIYEVFNETAALINNLEIQSKKQKTPTKTNGNAWTREKSGKENTIQ